MKPNKLNNNNNNWKRTRSQCAILTVKGVGLITSELQSTESSNQANLILIMKRELQRIECVLSTRRAMKLMLSTLRLRLRVIMRQNKRNNSSKERKKHLQNACCPHGLVVQPPPLDRRDTIEQCKIRLAKPLTRLKQICHQSRPVVGCRAARARDGRVPALQHLFNSYSDSLQMSGAKD